MALILMRAQLSGGILTRSSLPQVKYRTRNNGWFDLPPGALMRFPFEVTPMFGFASPNFEPMLLMLFGLFFLTTATGAQMKLARKEKSLKPAAEPN